MRSKKMSRSSGSSSRRWNFSTQYLPDGIQWKIGWECECSPRHHLRKSDAIATGFLKQGHASVGIARQYSGSLGKVANCQVTVNRTYAERTIAWPISTGWI